MLLNLKICGALLVMSFASMSLCNSAQAQQKEMVEPIFRVPKIAKLPKSALSTPQPTPQPLAIRPAATPRAAAPVNPRPVQPLYSPAARDLPAATPAIAQPIKSAPRSPSIVPLDNAKRNLVPNGIAKAVSAEIHPLDKAIQMAHSGLDQIHKNFHDYTAILVKRERVNNQLTDPAYMQIKIRNERDFGTHKQPLSIYMKFLRPTKVSGREVIWVNGQNQNKLIAHETSPLLRLKSFHLDPDGFVAMTGNRYPIYDAGIENLVKKLIEKAERDKKAGPCRVEYHAGAKINKRPCTLIEVTHDQRRAPYEFHKAKVYIDDEYNIPVRYAAYDWPVAGQSKLQLLEEYTYINVRMNVGLTDIDFDPRNPEYKYPKR